MEKKMKKTLTLILAALSLSLALTACDPAEETSKKGDENTSSAVSSTVSDTANESTAPVSNASCAEIRDEAYASERSDPEVHQLYDSKDNVMDEFMVSSYYGTLLESPDFTKLDSYAIFITDEPVVSEFGIFKASEDMTVDEIKAFCELRVDALKKKFEGYKPEMVSAAEGSVIGVFGDHVYYISTMENNSAIEALIKAKISG